MRVIVLLLVLLAFFCGSQTLMAQGYNVGGAVHVAIPTDDLGGAVGTGFGATGLFIYPLDETMAVGGQVGYLKFGGGSVEAFNSSVEWSYSAIPILGVFRYYLVPKGENMRFFVGGEAGFHRFSFSSETTVDDPFLGTFTQSFDGSSTEFSIAPLGGVEMANGLDVTAVFMITDLDYIGIRVGYTVPMGQNGQ